MPNADPWELYERIQQHTQAITDNGRFTFGRDELNIGDLIISGMIADERVELRGHRGFSGIVYDWYAGSRWAEAQFTISSLREREVTYADASAGLKLLAGHFGKPDVFGGNEHYLKYLRGIRRLNELLRLQIVKKPYS